MRTSGYNFDNIKGNRSVLTWHRGQLCGHVTLCADLLPGGCGKMKPPKLPEKRVIFIFRPACLLKVWVVATKHIQVGAVCHTAVSAPGGGYAVSCGRNEAGFEHKFITVITMCLLNKSFFSSFIYTFLVLVFNCKNLIWHWSPPPSKNSLNESESKGGCRVIQHLLSETCWESAGWGMKGRRCVEPEAIACASWSLEVGHHVGSKRTQRDRNSS